MFFEKSGGFSIEPEVIRSAAELGIRISFDLYEEAGVEVED